MNKCIITGRLVRDPELKFTASNTPVCNFTVAESRKYKDASGNERENKCFMPVQAWGKTAQTIAQYFRKGKPILVEGRMQTEQWTDKDGNPKSKLHMILEHFEFMLKDNTESDSGGNAGGYQESPPQNSAQAPDAGEAACDPDDLLSDDDIPF